MARSPALRTSQELLCEGSYGAGVGQVQLSDLQQSRRMRGPYAGRGLLPFLHVSAGHDHPRSYNMKRSDITSGGGGRAAGVSPSLTSPRQVQRRLLPDARVGARDEDGLPVQSCC